MTFLMPYQMQMLERFLYKSLSSENMQHATCNM